ncbi:hypothetical protein N8T08_001626 [Aspergillus melleus]|uniref:Uncharacterized protein n=1 Tax=Aspergillus melleus TaxID=138277 RepID=A0ACC3AN41_9EURO|nr:hypothetical protein N8T08_001626 [Aspergillus melleus]
MPLIKTTEINEDTRGVGSIGLAFHPVLPSSSPSIPPVCLLIKLNPSPTMPLPPSDPAATRQLRSSSNGMTVSWWSSAPAPFTTLPRLWSTQLA